MLDNKDILQTSQDVYLFLNPLNIKEKKRALLRVALQKITKSKTARYMVLDMFLALQYLRSQTFRLNE